MKSPGRDELVAVARIVRTRGIKGEVVADLLTDFPERFDGITELFAIKPEGAQFVVHVESHWFHDNRLVLKLKGYDSIDESKALAGYELCVPEEDVVELEEDEYYDWELQDCRVTSVTGEQIGRVNSIMHTGGVPVLLIQTADGKEHMVPLAEEICVKIDIEGKQITVDLPEGLLEI
jgi:16S rRNA processing protein RimM